MTEKKLFIVRKYIMAKSARDAIAKDRRTPVDDVFMDDDWREKILCKDGAIGFGAQDKTVIDKKKTS